MKLKSIVLLLAALSGLTAGQRAEFADGRASYADGEYKRAVMHFRLALRDNPDDAESYYWMGMSYQVLADIAAPFNGAYNSKARIYLTKAMELAPGRADYRREVFEFLLGSAAYSRTALRQAAGILLTVPESDPDYTDMRRHFEAESRFDSSADVRLGRLFLALPRAAYRVAALPASALSNRRDGEPNGSRMPAASHAVIAKSTDRVDH